MATLLLYDADCGFCERAISLAPRLRLRAHVAAIQETDLAAHGIDPQRASHEMPAVTQSGVFYGHRAIAAGLLTGPVPVRALGHLVNARPLTWLFAALYRWVATHRHELPGGTATCALPEESVTTG